MQNVSPKNAMARQARQLYLYGLVLLLVGLVLAALGVLIIIVPLTRAGWYTVIQVLALGGGIVLALVGLGAMIRGRTLPSENEQALQTAQVLGASLDDRYTFIRNVSGRGLGYIDAVLVGPNGALVFYFVPRQGEFYCEADVWLAQKGSQFLPAGIHPTHEAVRDVQALRRFLSQRGLSEMPVRALVVLTHPASAITTQQPIVPVTHLRTLIPSLQDDYLVQERVSQAFVGATVTAIMEE